MRTSSFSTLSARDWAAIKERRAWENAEREKQLLREDQTEYQKYVQTVEEDQRRVPPAYQVEPIPFEDWRTHADPSISDPVIRGAQATNKALLLKVRSDEAAEAEAERNSAREAVLAGKSDPAWKIPATAAGLSMSVEEARAFARQQGETFVKNNPDYFPNDTNFAAITRYLTEQGVTIPTEECLRIAWLRLRELGLIEERPAPAPAPAVPKPQDQRPGERPEVVTEEAALVDGWDIETGAPRKYSQAEIWRMSSADVKKAFRMWTDRDGTDRRPQFTRSRYE